MIGGEEMENTISVSFDNLTLESIQQEIKLIQKEIEFHRIQLTDYDRFMDIDFMHELELGKVKRDGNGKIVKENGVEVRTPLDAVELVTLASEWRKQLQERRIVKNQSEILKNRLDALNVIKEMLIKNNELNNRSYKSRVIDTTNIMKREVSDIIQSRNERRRSK